MKRALLFVLLVIFCALNMQAQIPEKFNYQGVLRNSSDEIVANTDISIRISLLEGSATSDEVYIETHSAKTNDYGQFSIEIGNGDPELGDFSDVNWSSGQVYLKTEVDESGGSTFTELSTVLLVTVPYALYAKNVENNDDADPDPANEIQDLDLTNDILTITNNSGATDIDLSTYIDMNTDEQDLNLKGDTLFISGGNNVVLPYDSSNWVINGTTMYYNEGNVGIGSSAPVSNLEVKSSAVGTNALFQVINANNDTVFAVYPDGVKVFVNPDAKGKVGGFAVSGRSPSKVGEVDYMRVTYDSTRIYVNDDPVKAKVGGFAVSGRSPSKGVVSDYLVITGDSTRIYVNDTISAKAKVGGFAVSGRSPSKGVGKEILFVSNDSTRVYINESAAKAKVGGFAVSGRSPSKGVAQKFMDMTKDNYFIGHESGQKTTDGLYNSFMGYESGASNTLGSNNSFIGYRTGYRNTEGDNNTFLGDSSGFGNTTGSGNLFVGKNSGIANEDGNNNSFLGSWSGTNNLTGVSNSFIGSFSGFSNSSGSYNTFVGDSSGYNNNEGSHNVYVGDKTGLYSNGNKNVVLGFKAGYFMENTDSCVFIGNVSGYNNTTGFANVFIGDHSGFTNNTGFQNIFVGTKSGYNNTIGSQNIAMGYTALYSMDRGVGNIAMGYSALYATIDGHDNIAIGQWALRNTQGSRNIGIGVGSGYSAQGENNIFIGFNAGASETGSDKLCIGTSELIYGDFAQGYVKINNRLGVGMTPTMYPLQVSGPAYKTDGSTLWITVSDKRIKTDIQDIENSFETILKLRPVKFKFTNEWKKRNPSIKDQYYYNFIAQEYQEVFPESVSKSGEYLDGDSDEILAIDTQNAQIVTIKAVQELIKEHELQKNELNKVRSELELIKSENQDLKKENEEFKTRLAKIEELLKKE